jgi:hypothetical protein
MIKYMIELILINGPVESPDETPKPVRQALWLGKENGKNAFLFSPEADKFDTKEEAEARLAEFKEGKIFPNHDFEINEHVFTDGVEVETAD